MAHDETATCNGVASSAGLGAEVSMGNIVKFRLRARPTRDQAKRWLVANIDDFPKSVPGYIGRQLFHGWRFVMADDNNVYFANCLEPGIGVEEFEQARSSA